MTPEEYQQFLIRQMRNAGMNGYIPYASQFVRNDVEEDIDNGFDSMKRANARVVETPKLK
jgi:hypothetical protein